jgi:hypothetical protein
VHQQYDDIIIDTLTGAVTNPYGHRELLIVLKREDDQGNDYVLTPTPCHDVPLEGAMFTAVNNFIRIRIWGGTPMLGSRGETVWPKGATPKFLTSSLDSFGFGPCEVVR